MKIGVLSDTHGIHGGIKKALEALGEVDMLIHAGDLSTDARYIIKQTGIETAYVRGNCDFDYDTPDELELELDGWKVYLTHGHLYGVKYGLDELAEKAWEINAHICIYGHTHMTHLEELGGCTFLNPGSPSYPRMSNASCALMEITADARPEIHIIEL